MATVRMPNSLQAQITRKAISPRLAIRIFLNMKKAVRYELRATRLKAILLKVRVSVACAERVAQSAQLKHKKARSIRAPKSTRSFLRPDGKKLLPVLDRLAVAAEFLHNFAGHIRLNFIEQLHRFDD